MCFLPILIYKQCVHLHAVITYGAGLYTVFFGVSHLKLAWSDGKRVRTERTLRSHSFCFLFFVFFVFFCFVLLCFFSPLRIIISYCCAFNFFLHLFSISLIHYSNIILSLVVFIFHFFFVSVLLYTCIIVLFSFYIVTRNFLCFFFWSTVV